MSLVAVVTAGLGMLTTGLGDGEMAFTTMVLETTGLLASAINVVNWLGSMGAAEAVDTGKRITVGR